MKKCKDCNLLLEENKFEKNRRVCKKCRLEKRKNTHKLTCKECSKTFTNSRKDAFFCSKKCQSKDRENRVIVECDYCKNTFEVVKSRIKQSAKLHCSHECKVKNSKSKIIKKCNSCGKDVEKDYHYKDKTAYCSSRCFYNYNTGENVHNYNKDLTEEERINKRKYPEYYQWRNNVFQRDDFTCQCCLSKGGIELNAHHIKNYSTHKDLRTSINNGITLCKSCHKEFHKRYTYFNNNEMQLKDFFKTRNANTEVIENITRHRNA